MKFIFLFCLFFVWDAGLISAKKNDPSKSAILGSKVVLSTAAEGIKKGVEIVPGLSDVVFGDCVEAPFSCPNENVTFWYYSNENPEKGVQLPNSEGNIPNLPRSSNPWKVLIHGYTKSKDEIPNPQLKSAYFRRGQYNIISVDYAPLARSKCYAQAVNNVPVIAKCTAGFLDRLMDGGYFRSDNLHVIGFSLGAQIAGQIYKYLKHEKPYRVTALDPASPLFDGLINDRLTAEAGGFVDVVHTNALMKGHVIPSGHVDFYVNGGSVQPGCLTSSDKFSTCNHDRSPKYFAESINSSEGFWGIPCESYTALLTGACNTDEAKLVPMGEDIPLTAKGMYFLQTTGEPPYALGKRTSAKLL